MADLSFHGGVGEIGGNTILLEEGDTKVLFDLGKNFTKEGDYFSEFLQPKKARGLEDFLELGLLPDWEGIYRRDYLKHQGEKPAEEPAIDAVFLTHGHVDHIGYVHFLRPDIPLYCSPTTKAIMETRQKTGSMTFNRYVEMTETFQFRKKANGGGFTRITKRDHSRNSVEHDPVIKRKIHTLENEDSVSVGPVNVTASSVNHSLPGALAFLIESGDSRIVYTGDLRLHGYTGEKTRKFIDRAREFEPDVLISEGTNLGQDEDGTTEKEVRKDLGDFISDSGPYSIVNFPDFDLERMYSVVQAACQHDRNLALRTKQAYLLKKLEGSGLLEFDDLSINSGNIDILAATKSWGTPSYRFRDPSGRWGKIDELNMSEGDRDNLIKKDYSKWEQDLISRENAVTLKEIQSHPEDYVLYCDYYHLNDLIGLKPAEGRSFIWSKTDPFTPDMEVDQDRVNNWLEHFRLEMVKAHASGHLFPSQLKNMVQKIGAERTIPVHTEAPEQFKNFGPSTEVPALNERYSL